MHAPGYEPVNEPKIGWLHRLRRLFYPKRWWDRYLDKLGEREARYQRYRANLPVVHRLPASPPTPVRRYDRIPIDHDAVNKAVASLAADDIRFFNSVRRGTGSTGPK